MNNLNGLKIKVFPADEIDNKEEINYNELILHGADKITLYLSADHSEYISVNEILKKRYDTSGKLELTFSVFYQELNNAACEKRKIYSIVEEGTYQTLQDIVGKYEIDYQDLQFDKILYHEEYDSTCHNNHLTYTCHNNYLTYTFSKDIE